jgi:zinc protease
MAKPADVAGTFFVREKGGIREYKLGANDLQILLAPDPSVPVAGCMVTYHVGSRNEAVGHTGSTHLLEHLMFKGSDKFNKENGHGIWHELEKRGALMNATTWLDRTNYFEVLPKEHIGVALAIEADRMRHAWIREEDRASEMTVVRNEFERGENDPMQALDKLIWATAYQAHPYHHPTIGWRSDIETVSIERLKAFYDEFYWPNNATLTVAGDFDEAAILKQIVETFGKLERSPESIPPMLTTEPPQEGERRVVVSRKDPANMVGVGYKMPDGRHADMPALLLASLILGEGKTSRIHKALVDKALATNIFMYVMPFYDPSPFLAYATLTDKATHQEVEKIIKAEYARLAKNPPSAAEMQAAKRLYRSMLASRRDGPYAFLNSINEDIARGDWTLFLSFPDAIEKASARDVSRVVKHYLIDDSQSTVGYFLGTKAPQKVVVHKRKPRAQRRRPAFRIPRAKKPKRAKARRSR